MLLIISRPAALTGRSGKLIGPGLHNLPTARTVCPRAGLDVINPSIPKTAGTAQATVATDPESEFPVFIFSVVHYSAEVFHIWRSMLSDDVQGKWT